MKPTDVRRAAFDTIRERGRVGISRGEIQTRLGVSDPQSEHARQQVWKIAAGLASLTRDGVVTLDNGRYRATAS